MLEQSMDTIAQPSKEILLCIRIIFVENELDSIISQALNSDDYNSMEKLIKLKVNV